MNVVPLKPCTAQPNASIMFDNTITPLDRLRLVGDKEFEDIVVLWAGNYLSTKYINVCEIGGSRDSGRDIIGYLSETNMADYDLYQCKKYNSPLVPSEYYVEFGKLCYYTYINEYTIPNKYYIVASNGIGPSLRVLVENPARINQILIENWNACCGRNRQVLAQGLPLDDRFKNYINNFDFSIVADISPETLLTEFSQTKWFKYYFGGGLKPRPNVPRPSTDVSEKEENLPYVSQLLNVYSEDANTKFRTCKDLKNHKLSKHLQEQRHYFHSAQALQRFARDELIDDSAYDQVKAEVNYGIRTTIDENHTSSLQRVDMTVDKARTLPITNDELKTITTLDKCGICHELVNDGDISWYETEQED